MSVSFLEQAKIQAQVLVPVLKAFQAEFGMDRANEIARKALELRRKQNGIRMIHLPRCESSPGATTADSLVSKKDFV